MLKIKNIHFVGIGGVGMSGIAEVLHNQGYNVSGSDISKNSTVTRLEKLGIKVFIGHSENNISNADVVVVSTAINLNNPELKASKDKKIPIIKRAAMLAELMRFSKGIAVAGTHGKTTTTSLVASLLDQGGLEPTYVIGGKLNSLGSNARLGKGKYFVAEADESDGSFMYLNPVISIITNIDSDHLETYDNDLNKLKQTFVDFTDKLPFYGFAVICIDDEGVKSIVDKISRPFITYGFSDGADVQAVDWSQEEGVSSFKVKIKDQKHLLNINLNMPGKHNVLNSLAAITVALEVGVEPKQIQETLNIFSGVGRRFQTLGEFYLDKVYDISKKITVIDDYGHHPKEIEAVIDSVRAGWSNRRLVVVYQLHRYSRTKALFNNFVKTLSKSDKLLMLDVYSAGEDKISGADTKSVCKAIENNSNVNPIHITDKSSIAYKLLDIIEPGDIILMQGAGDISKLAYEVVDTFASKLNMLDDKAKTA